MSLEEYSKLFERLLYIVVFYSVAILTFPVAMLIIAIAHIGVTVRRQYVDLIRYGYSGRTRHFLAQRRLMVA